jgi:hypothetical protein
MLAVEFARFLGLEFTGRANITDIVNAVCATAAHTQAGDCQCQPDIEDKRRQEVSRRTRHLQSGSPGAPAMAPESHCVDGVAVDRVTIGDPADRLFGHAQKYLCFSEKPAL